MKKLPENNLKIGIPNTLFSSYHLSYWREFITLSGMEAVLSDDSAKETADRGGRLLPHEFCIPVKVFMGHILNLLELLEKGVDQILIPRMNAQGKGNFFCPKLIGLPEIVRYGAHLEEKMIFSPEVTCNGPSLRMVRFPTLSSLSLTRMKTAEQQANRNSLKK